MNPKTIFRALVCTAALFWSANVFAGDATETTDAKSSPIVQSTPVSHDLFSLTTTYTGGSNVNSFVSLGTQDVVSTDFTYGHRFQIEGNWYLRTGMEYLLYDFGGSTGPLPKQLQALSALVAVEYVVQDFAAVSVELRPGFAFENDISSQSFDVPFDIYTSFPIVKDKVFGMAGVFYGRNFNPEVSPIGGVIWLINDKTRLQALFPQSALVYSFSDDLDLSLNAEISGYGFRMDKDDRAYSDARVLYTYKRVGAKATYKGWKPFEVGV